MRTPKESIKHRDTWSWHRPVASGREAIVPGADIRGAPRNQGARVSMAAFVAGLARPYRAWLRREHSHALDLSDAGLRADLEGRAEGTAERLAIEC